MKEIISDEFIRYKSGFISGKNEVIELFKLGKLINLNKKNENRTLSWYDYGFEDGFKYFFTLFNDNNFKLDDINMRILVKESFLKRVIKINQSGDKKISVSKFKM